MGRSEDDRYSVAPAGTSTLYIELQYRLQPELALKQVIPVRFAAILSSRNGGVSRIISAVFQRKSFVRCETFWFHEPLWRYGAVRDVHPDSSLLGHSSTQEDTVFQQVTEPEEG